MKTCDCEMDPSFGNTGITYCALHGAAPDLLAALEKSAETWADLVRWLAAAKVDDHYDIAGLQSFRDAATVHADKARKAIARAKGE